MAHYLAATAAARGEEMLPRELATELVSQVSKHDVLTVFKCI